MEKERREQADKTADNLWAAVERASGLIKFIRAICGNGVKGKTKYAPTDLITLNSKGRCHAINEARVMLEAYRFKTTMHEESFKDQGYPLL